MAKRSETCRNVMTGKLHTWGSVFDPTHSIHLGMDFDKNVCYTKILVIFSCSVSFKLFLQFY